MLRRARKVALASRRAGSSPIETHRLGFSVLEVMISLAIIVTLAVVIVPSVDLLIEKARMDLIEDQLRKIEDGITAFRDKTATNPGRLYHLSRPITTGDSTPCGTYSNQEVNAWAGTPPTGGPYVNEVFPDGPIKIATFGTADPVLVRDPPTQGGTQRYAFLYYTISGVTRTDAIEINERIDGSADLDPSSPDNLTGTIQWDNPDAEGFVTVTYRMLVPRNTC
jgi:type II secretory pathway pseudopilin PulG